MRAADQARTLVAAARTAALATLSENGSPWASLVQYATLADGRPVLCLSTLAEHGRNVVRDPRASLMVSDGGGLAGARVTLAGRLRIAEDAERAALPGNEFAGFTHYVLEVERVRWVGGYGRMATIDPQDYARLR